MKKIIAIGLILALVVQTTSQLWITAMFSLKQNEIASTVCINRMKPIPICKGSCFLEQQLEDNRDNQEHFPDLKPVQFNLHGPIHLLNIPEPKETLLTQSYLEAPKDDFAVSGHQFGVFRPPIFYS